MPALIIFLVIAIATVICYIKFPSFKDFVNKMLTPAGGQVNEKRIEHAKSVLESEKEKTAALKAKAEAAKKMRQDLANAKKAIHEEINKQEAAKKVIKGVKN